jgi:mannonate dehydratase
MMVMRPRLSMPLIDLSAERLRLYRQAGAEEVSLPSGALGTERIMDRPVRPLVPPAQLREAGRPGRWDEDELRRMIARCAEFGLEACARELPLSGALLGGQREEASPAAQQQRQADLATVTANICTAAAAGIRVLTWNFTALRSSEGYGAVLGGGRGGADLRDFDSARLGREPLPEGPPLPCTHEQMWERLRQLLHVIVPVAERAGVVLALHPTDPPVAVFRGVAQILTSFVECQRLVLMVDSPSNCFFLDTVSERFRLIPLSRLSVYP